MGPLEASRVAQRLPQGPMAAHRRRPSLAEPVAPPSAIDHCVLEAGFFIRMNPLYYARLSSEITTGSTPVVAQVLLRDGPRRPTVEALHVTSNAVTGLIPNEHNPLAIR